MRVRILVVGMLTACALGLVPLALVEAQINIGINSGAPPPPIVITAPPQLVVIPGGPVSYAPALPYNYFFYGGKYYVVHEGAWFMGPAYHGPWTFVAVEKVPKPVLRVPVGYYKIPPGHLKDKGPPPWAGHGKGPKHKQHKDDND